MTISPAELASSGLLLDVDGAVATVTLNRPERRNAMTPGMWRGLAAVAGMLPPRTRVVIVRGAGPSFSSGIDLRMFSAEGGTRRTIAAQCRRSGFRAGGSLLAGGLHLAA